jgi:pilus assembly protein CpaB
LSRRLFIGILIAVLGIAVALGGVFWISRLFQDSLITQPLPTQPAITYEQVIVAGHDMRLGEVMRAEDLQVVQMPIENIPLNAVRSIEEANGRYTKVDLVMGEMILQHHLADPTNISHDIGYTITDNQVMMAFPASDLISALGIIQRGDIVDLLVTMEVVLMELPESEEGIIDAEGELVESPSELFTFNAMQRINITATVVDIIPPPEGSNEPPTTTIRAYLLALSPQDALVLKHLVDTGADMDFVLRSPTSRQPFELIPVNQDYLIDRFQLQPRER